MLWIYLAVSQETLSDSQTTSAQSLTVKQTDMLKPSFFPECQTEASPEHPSAPMLLGWMDMHSGVRWTSSLPDSHARTLALQERARDWEESEAVFFTKSCAWPKKSSPRSYSLKTSQQSEHGDWTALSRNLPPSGMTCGGRCYPLEKLEPHIKGTDGFAWLPTPSASSYGSNQGGAAGRVGRKRYSLESMAKYNLWPTPTSKMTNRSREAWEAHRARPNNKSGGMDLTVWVQKHPGPYWPTPQARDGTARGHQSPEKRKAGGHSVGLGDAIGGQLNPEWVEWLMGFPLDWTALSDLGMQWFQLKQKKRSKS